MPPIVVHTNLKKDGLLLTIPSPKEKPFPGRVEVGHRVLGDVRVEIPAPVDRMEAQALS